MSNSFDEFLTEQLQDEDFRKEYEALQLERSSIQSLIDAKKQAVLTQKQLSGRTDIAQGNISKTERGVSDA